MMAKRIPVYDDKDRDKILGFAETTPDGTIHIKIKVDDIMNLDKRFVDYDDLIAFMLGFYFHVPGGSALRPRAEEMATRCEGCGLRQKSNPDCTKEVTDATS